MNATDPLYECTLVGDGYVCGLVDENRRLQYTTDMVELTVLQQRFVYALETDKRAMLEAPMRMHAVYTGKNFGVSFFGVFCEVYHDFTGRGIWIGNGQFQWDNGNYRSLPPFEVVKHMGLSFQSLKIMRHYLKAHVVELKEAVGLYLRLLAIEKENHRG